MIIMGCYIYKTHMLQKKHNNTNINKATGNLIIISSPSGAGKTSITKKLLEIYDNLELSVSVTTRPKRENEIEAKDYFFISKEQYDLLLENNELLEYASVFGNHYGTPKKFVLEKLAQGKNIIFDIDWQGARELTKHTEFNIITIFILPPSISILHDRLIKRKSDDENIIQKRMSKAKAEISHYHEYDYVVLNDNFADTIAKIKKIIDFNALTYIKPYEFDNFVKENLQ